MSKTIVLFKVNQNGLWHVVWHDTEKRISSCNRLSGLTIENGQLLAAMKGSLAKPAQVKMVSHEEYMKYSNRGQICHICSDRSKVISLAQAWDFGKTASQQLAGVAGVAQKLVISVKSGTCQTCGCSTKLITLTANRAGVESCQSCLTAALDMASKLPLNYSATITSLKKEKTKS